MRRRTIGERVGAILSATDEQVELLGYGVYQGELEPPKAHELLVMSPEEYAEWKKDVPQGLTNPCIKLDNGRTVWGYQCWWASEERVRMMIGDRRVVDAVIEEG